MHPPFSRILAKKMLISKTHFTVRVSRNLKIFDFFFFFAQNSSYGSPLQLGIDLGSIGALFRELWPKHWRSIFFYKRNLFVFEKVCCKDWPLSRSFFFFWPKNEGPTWSRCSSKCAEAFFIKIHQKLHTNPPYKIPPRHTPPPLREPLWRRCAPPLREPL